MRRSGILDGIYRDGLAQQVHGLVELLSIEGAQRFGEQLVG